MLFHCSQYIVNWQRSHTHTQIEWFQVEIDVRIKIICMFILYSFHFISFHLTRRWWSWWVYRLGNKLDLFTFHAWFFFFYPTLFFYCMFFFSPTGEMIITNDRYHMTETENSMYAVQMTLVIRKLQKSDMGGYKCISKNSIGDAEGTIRIYGELNFL